MAKLTDYNKWDNIGDSSDDEDSSVDNSSILRQAKSLRIDANNIFQEPLIFYF